MYIPYSDYKEKTMPDIVINRTRDVSVSLWYEENNVRVLHSSLITETGNDKFRTIEYLKNNLPSDFKLKKWAPYTEFISKEELKEYLQNYNSDKEVVIKSVDGHGGNQVCLLSEQPQPDLSAMYRYHLLRVRSGKLRLRGKAVVQCREVVPIQRKKLCFFLHAEQLQKFHRWDEPEGHIGST